MVRYKSSRSLSYARQGYICYTSRLYPMLSAWDQRRIEELCVKCGGEYADALLEYVTTGATKTEVCRRHNLSESTLYRAEKRYYAAFPKKL